MPSGLPRGIIVRTRWGWGPSASEKSMRLLKRAGWLFAVIAVAPALVFPRAQSAVSTRQIDVSETAGIRRTEYPVNARVELPRGALRDVSNARLRGTDERP